MSDDFLRAAGRLLPPEVDFVILPAVRAVPIDVTPDDARAGVAAARDLVVRTLHSEWAAACGGLPAPATATVECRQSSDDGQLLTVSALGRHAGLGAGEVSARLETAVASLTARGWAARRRNTDAAAISLVELRRGELTLTVTAWSTVPAYDVEVRSGDVAVGERARGLLHDPISELPWGSDV